MEGSWSPLSSTLGAILSRDDTPRSSQLAVQEGRCPFHFGVTNGPFVECVKGTRQERKARFMFGSQFTDIADIVFHDVAFEYVSLEWKLLPSCPQAS